MELSRIIGFLWMQRSDSFSANHYLFHKQRKLLKVLCKPRDMIRCCALNEGHDSIIVGTVSNPHLSAKIFDWFTNNGSILSFLVQVSYLAYCRVEYLQKEYTVCTSVSLCSKAIFSSLDDLMWSSLLPDQMWKATQKIISIILF